MPTRHQILERRFDVAHRSASGSVVRITFEVQPLAIHLPTPDELAVAVGDSIATASRKRMKKVSGPLSRLAAWAIETDKFFTVSDTTTTVSDGLSRVSGPKNPRPSSNRGFERMEKDFGVHNPTEREIDIALDLFFTPEALLGGRQVAGFGGLAERIGIE